MKKLVAIFLTLVLLLCACSSPAVPTQSPEATAVTEPTLSEEDAQAILWDRRKAVEAEMLRTMSVLWRCNEDIVYSFVNRSNGPEADAVTNPNSIVTLKAGRIYSGLPYTHASGSADSFLSYGKPGRDGVYILKGLASPSLNGSPGDKPYRYCRVGTDCADAVFWAWAKVSSSIRFTCTGDMTEVNGCLKVGDYVCDDLEYKNTVKTVKANGEETMFAAYAQLQKGDALVMYNGSGHAILVKKIHVVYKDGKINPGKSFAVIHEQLGRSARKGKTYYDEDLGEKVYILGTTNNKFSFQKLYDNGYLPITCQELIDPSTLEAPVVTDSLTEYTLEDIYSGTLTSNYRISHVTMEITDTNGKILQSATCYPREVDMYEIQLQRFVVDAGLGVLNGKLDPDALPEGTYTCTVTCHVSTGDDIIARQFDFHK